MWGVGSGSPPFEGGMKGGSRTKEDSKTRGSYTARKPVRFACRVWESMAERCGIFEDVLGSPPNSPGWHSERYSPPG